jgi:hypothetical protein
MVALDNAQEQYGQSVIGDTLRNELRVVPEGTLDDRSSVGALFNEIVISVCVPPTD